MVIVKKQCNNIENKPIKDNTSNLNKHNILGYDLFPEIYSSIFLVARKRSGKTSTIMNILQNCSDRDTKIIVFCSTCEHDVAYKAIAKYLDKMKIDYEFHQSINDNGYNHLEALINEMKDSLIEEEEEQALEEPEQFKEEVLLLNGYKIVVKKPIKRKKNKKPKKKISPKYIVIFDDISAELKDKNIAVLLKQNRHYKSKIIISSQYILDILPEARNQIQYYLIFGGINEQKLFEIYKNANLNIDFDEFMKMYEDATSTPYNFFYVSTYCDYRHNFNKNYSCEK